MVNFPVFDSALPQRRKGDVHEMGKGKDGVLQQWRQRFIWIIDQRSQMQIYFCGEGKRVIVCDNLHYKFSGFSILRVI